MIIGIILTVTEFIGRFHPLLVHLPVGILLLAVIFHLLAYKKKFEILRPAVQYSLLLGTLAAVASCISGYLLSNSGDYEEALVSKHQWFGIAVAVVSGLAWFLMIKNSVLVKWMMPLIAILIIITGHLGGSLTHGEDYLTQGFSSEGGKNNSAVKMIPDVQRAVVYNDIVQPILQSKCYSCHGPNKQKGKLRLDVPSFIDKGGEDGKIIVGGSAAASELIKRLLLPLDNKDHMPPKEKPQPGKEQVELLNWWVNSGADYHKKVAELEQPEKIKPYLMALQNGKTPVDASVPAVPAEPVDKAPDDVVQQLKKLDVAVTPVSQTSNYLSVNFVAVDSVTTQHIRLLQSISRQVAWLKLSNTKISDSLLLVVGKMPSLTRLFLNNSNATDKAILYLNNLSSLQYLNVSSTAVSAKGLNSLAGLKHLRQLYVYRSGIGAENFGSLKKIFPSVQIDTGGYAVEFLPTDTMLVKEKPKKG